MISPKNLFRAIARRYQPLIRQIVELDYTTTEIETSLYSPISADPSRIISSKTSRGYVNYSKISTFEKLDYVKDKQFRKKMIIFEINKLIKKCNPALRPYVYEACVKQKSVRTIAEGIGTETEMLRKKISAEIDKYIAPNLIVLLELCRDDKYMTRVIEEEVGHTMQEIIDDYEKQE